MLKHLRGQGFLRLEQGLGNLPSPHPVMHVARGKCIGWYAAKITFVNGFRSDIIYYLPIWTQKNEVITVEVIFPDGFLIGIPIDERDIAILFETLQSSCVVVVVFAGSIHGTFLLTLAGTGITHLFTVIFDTDGVPLKFFPLFRQPEITRAEQSQPEK